MFVGTAKATVVGIGDYYGSLEKEFIISKAEQILTASGMVLDAGEGSRIDVKGAKGNLKFESSDPSIVTVDEYGNVWAGFDASGKSVTITIHAEETSNYKAAEPISISVMIRKTEKIDISDVSVAIKDS